MRTALQRVFLFALAVLLAGLLAMPADAQNPRNDNPSFAPTCHATSGLARGFDEMVEGSAWTCKDIDWRAHEPVAWLRFDRERWAGEERPRYFFSRNARHETISFAALDADGTLRTLEWQEADAKPFAAGPVFQLELPEIRAETVALIARIERPHSVPLLTEARLTFYSEDGDWSKLEMMILACVVGMLILPLFFDLTFFIVLRERFIVLHAMMVVAMIGYTLFAGGLIALGFGLSMRFIAIVTPLLWAIGCGISALFLASFLEKGAQSPLMRRLTILVGWWTILVPGSLALQLHATQSFGDRLYFLSFVPIIALFTAALIEALWRGSRSARFIAFSWTPIILASIERFMRGTAVYVGPSSLDQAIYVAVALEVMVMSLAIGDRFLAIRRERDAALTEARMLEQLSDHDPLTGLLNRRGFEAKFPQLVAEGFGTFALVDLDRFKTVNDTLGHQAGDAALVACAQALRGGSDPDLVAARLGGEEFVVLLRGENARQRAEALRQSIPLRMTAQVDGLQAPITASMGIVEMPVHSRLRMSFDDLYARADLLMYEAKANGRNRMTYERVTLFENPAAAAMPPASGNGPGKERRGRDRRAGDQSQRASG